MLKIFISSTCYDFKEERKHIADGLRLIGHSVDMSDEDDVLFDPNNHTHIDCLEAVKKQQILIYLIGYRFGGKAIEEAITETDLISLELSNKDFFKENTKLSITQCEVLTAIKYNIPIYTFIREELHAHHEVYEKNKKLDFPDKFDFPKIKNLEEAKYIFEFFNFLRKRENSNAYKPFKYSNDVLGYMKKQLSKYFSKLISERSSIILDSEEAEILPATVVAHRSSDREKIFSRFYQNLNKGETVRILGTGVTNFLKNDDKVHSLLRDGNNIEILLINNNIVKNDWNCTSDSFIEKLQSEKVELTVPSELKVLCPLAELNFLIDTNHFNNYHSRNNYNRRIEQSINLIREYKEEYKNEKEFGTIEAKHFRSFVPLSITAKYQDGIVDNDLIAEFILPFSKNRIIFHSGNDEKSTVYELFMDFFNSTWDSSVYI